MVAAAPPNSRGEKKTPSRLCLNQRAAENERLVLCSGTGRQFYVWGGGGGDAISAWHAAGGDQYVC